MVVGDGAGSAKQKFQGFFSALESIELIKAAAEKIDAISDSAFDERISRFKKFTYLSLSFFWQNPKVVDDNCLYCIESFGEFFKVALNNFNADIESDLEGLESIALFCYKLITELEITHRNGLPSLLQGWPTSIKEEYFLNYNNKAEFKGIHQRMAVGVLRNYLHRKELVTLAELPQLIKKGESFKGSLEKSLKERSDEVDRLKLNLDDYERSFNFLGLNRAFRSMRSLKLKEARNTLRFLVVLGMLMLAPLMAKVGMELFGSDPSIVVNNPVQAEASVKQPAVTVVVPNEKFDSISGKNSNTEKRVSEDDKAAKYVKQMLAVLTFLGFELVLLYFFKVGLHNYRSVKSQLLQIDLRVALTQFILKYSEFAGAAAANSSGTFERFEQVIFSGIVGGDSEIPATFDGLDQMVKVLEKVRPA